MVFLRHLGIVALALGAATVPALAGAATIVGPSARLAGTQDLGAISRSAPVNFALTLGYRHASQLDALVDAQSDPSSPLYGHFLSSAQFNAYFAPMASDYTRVEAALGRAGLRVAHPYANRTVVDVTGPATLVERYFNTTLHAFSQPGHGQRHANVTSATLPADLAGTVDAVIGLDNRVRGRFLYQFGHRSGLAGVDAFGGPLHGPDGGFGPLAIAKGFDFPVEHGYGGKGLAIGNVAGDVADTDLAAFETYFGIKRKGQLLRTTIEGGSSGANVEAALDTETMASLNPDADIHLYILSNPLGQTGIDAYNQIVTDNSVVAVNSSFGECEGDDPSYDKAATKVIEQGQALGITWSAATGDGGAFQCSGPQIVPAAIPRVTGVGGTSLFVTAKGAYTSESAWNGSGGGPSSVFKIPMYQKGVSGLASTTARNLPDIAFPADPNTGASLYYLGAWVGPIGGTSWASPTFVALQTGIDQIRGSSGGYVNPKIYRVFAKSQYKTFHDITTGNNGFPAVAGYDNATGIGSVIGYPFAKRE